MDATSISKSVGQEPRHSTATATAIRFGRPFVIKNLKSKIKNSPLFHEIPRSSAKFRLTIRPLNCLPCRSLGEGGWNHLNQGPLRELTRNNANYRLTLQPAMARGSLPPAVVAAGATGEMWQVRLALPCRGSAPCGSHRPTPHASVKTGYAFNPARRRGRAVARGSLPLYNDL